MSSTSLHVEDQRIPPVRGLIPLHNARGQTIPDLDVRRCIGLNRMAFKTPKIDLLVHGAIPDTLDPLLVYASTPNTGINVELSLRTDCTGAPDRLDLLKARGLFDVFLCPRSLDSGDLDRWLDACSAQELPMRLQVRPPFTLGGSVEDWAERVADAGVKSVNIVLDDPFMDSNPDRGNGQATLDAMNALASALDARDVEANLIGVPLCLVGEEHLPKALNRRQFFLSHQQYSMGSYGFAEKIFARRPWAIHKIIVYTAAGETSRGTFVDRALLGWLTQKRPYLYALVSIYRKATRHLGILNRLPRTIENSKEAYVKAVEKIHRKAAKAAGQQCSQCTWRAICDHETPLFKRHLPGVSVEPQREEFHGSPMHFASHQRGYYDPIDEIRRTVSETQLALVEKANDIVTNREPTREFGFNHYLVENAFCVQMPGAVEWYSLTNTEKISTIIGWFDAPFTVSITFGGGFADQIGFGTGYHAKLVCPMEAYTHKLVLHVDKGGNYVLLRDGVLIRPTEFEGTTYVPTKIPTVAPLRLSVWNIDRFIHSQNLLVWEGDPKAVERREKVKYSVIIVSMRFTRRLQAVLRCLAHQEGVDPADIEVIVAYVPGLDAVDDLLSSVELSFPELRIVRSPFSERHVNQKGYLINQSGKLASGDWVILLDSDILVPSNLFTYLDDVPESDVYAAPDRRKMLTKETTAKVLLGELEPWNDWEELVEGPGQMRVREGGYLPIGFIQCVRKSCLDEVEYEEYGHYQGADWDFIVNVHDKCGPGKWLEGVAVLHLDHGGSQWYGAQRQL